ncbi:MAG: efflux RND transporter periplasmic adaptor subunit [Oligoflexia bacterium]|nr:efflux RND transporter periplasmic adaptor subunit [Oligoflexia bacterium]
MRSIGEWIGRRKILSSLIAVFLIGAVATIQIFAHAYSGQLSEPLEKGTIIDAVYGIGTVTAYKRFSFNPQVSNTVTESYVMEGDSVKKGAPLLKTDVGLKHYAPFDGVVNFFPYRNGENAYPTTPMMVVTNMRDRYIVVSMEQQGAMKVKVGQTAKISFDSLRDQIFEGKVSSVYSYLSNFYARIDTVQIPDYILPDMTCDVAIVIGVRENALLVPLPAFIKGSVWAKRGNGLPHVVPVKLGVIDGTHAEVIEGDLQAGDRVLIRPQAGS